MPLASLTPYPRNAQKHSQAEVEDFAKWLLTVGYTEPAVVWPNGNGKTYYAAGHLRNLAMLWLGETQIPAISRPEWSEQLFRTYVIRDNQQTKKAQWDIPLLKDELVDLDTGEFDLELTSFSKSDVYALIHGKAEKEDDSIVPEAEDNIIARLSFPAAVWLGKREEVTDILGKMEKSYLCKVTIDE